MRTNRDPILTTLADKYAVRAYVADRVSESILTDLYAVVRDPADLDLSALPTRCAIKATHASWATILVDDRAPVANRIPPPRRLSSFGVSVRVRPERLQEPEFLALTRAWLAEQHSPEEWAYKGVARRLIVEELLDSGGSSPNDVKFWCVAGRVRFIVVDVDRYRNHRRSIHLPDWTPIDGEITSAPRSANPASRPAHFEEMLTIAERLARGLDFIRVDLYSTPERVVFGEMTNYPGAGGDYVTPESVFADLVAEWDPLRWFARGRRGERRECPD